MILNIWKSNGVCCPARATLQQRIQLEPDWAVRISMFQYIPVCTVLQILVLPCTSMYLHIIPFLVQSCTTLYHLVPPCTMTVQDSTYRNILVRTDLGNFYVSTYWYVPFWGFKFSYRHVARSVRTGMYHWQYKLPCTAIHQVYRIPEVAGPPRVNNKLQTSSCPTLAYSVQEWNASGASSTRVLLPKSRQTLQVHRD